jgi:hypothetical protein
MAAGESSSAALAIVSMAAKCRNGNGENNVENEIIEINGINIESAGNRQGENISMKANEIMAKKISAKRNSVISKWRRRRNENEKYRNNESINNVMSINENGYHQPKRRQSGMAKEMTYQLKMAAKYENMKESNNGMKKINEEISKAAEAAISMKVMSKMKIM